MLLLCGPYSYGQWQPATQSVVTTNTTNVDDANTPYEVEHAQDLEIVETVEIEREFDENGNVIKEKRTVSKPRVIPRDLPPRTPLRPEKPFRDIGYPEKDYEPYTAPQRPYKRPWDTNPGIQPNTAPWNPTGPYWIGDPPPGSSPQIWCQTYTPPQTTYTVNGWY